MLTEAHGTTADVGDGGVVYSVPAGQWACLGVSWWRDVAASERREQGVAMVSGATSCTGALRACLCASWRALDVTGTSWAGCCWRLLGRGLGPTCSGE